MSPRRYRITVRGTVFDVEVGGLDASPVTVTVDGVEYEVDLPGAAPSAPAARRAAPRAVAAPAAPRPSAPRPSVSNQAGEGVVRAMMPGRIVSVNVSEGERVDRNHPLLIIESMKMEQTIASPQEGTVRSVHVQAGDSVQHGQTLVELE